MYELSCMMREKRVSGFGGVPRTGHFSNLASASASAWFPCTMVDYGVTS